MSLFQQPSKSRPPLAERMRPSSLEEVLGQQHLIGPDGALRRAAEQGEVPSMILWGPPGSGKTTLIRLVGQKAGLEFRSFSAVLSGIKEVREFIAHAEQTRRAYGTRTLLFIDEIHRFNRAQQDAFLPHVEAGTVVLAGATTENPSFEVNAALLSRCLVFPLYPIARQSIEEALRRAFVDSERGLGRAAEELSEQALQRIAISSSGDLRRALNMLELAAAVDPQGPLTEKSIGEATRVRTLRYDRRGEEHFNLISAFQKSIRSSDPDAALYWMARMLHAGEDPMYVARRLVRTASEDIGNADPNGLPLALAAREAFRQLGSPEGELALAQAVVFLAAAPKSNAVNKALGKVNAEIEKGKFHEVPLHLRNAPTETMKELGYGRGYEYDHAWEEGVSPQSCLPSALAGTRFYEPVDRGEELEIANRLERWRALKSAAAGQAPEDPES